MTLFIYKDILNLDDSIIHAGIMNKYGVLLNVEHRDHILPPLTDEENEEYAWSKGRPNQNQSNYAVEPNTLTKLRIMHKYLNKSIQM